MLCFVDLLLTAPVGPTRALCRADPFEDETDGFFVALFVRCVEPEAVAGKGHASSKRKAPEPTARKPGKVARHETRSLHE